MRRIGAGVLRGLALQHGPLVRGGCVRGRADVSLAHQFVRDRDGVLRGRVVPRVAGLPHLLRRGERRVRELGGVLRTDALLQRPMRVPRRRDLVLGRRGLLRGALVPVGLLRGALRDLGGDLHHTGRLLHGSHLPLGTLRHAADLRR